MGREFRQLPLLDQHKKTLFLAIASRSENHVFAKSTHGKVTLSFSLFYLFAPNFFLSIISFTLTFSWLIFDCCRNFCCPNSIRAVVWPLLKYSAVCSKIRNSLWMSWWLEILNTMINSSQFWICVKENSLLIHLSPDWRRVSSVGTATRLRVMDRRDMTQFSAGKILSLKPSRLVLVHR